MSDDDLDARVIANLRELQRRNAVRPDPPPLRIHHLLVCAVVAAVLLSLSRFAMLRYPQQALGMASVQGFSQVLLAIGLTLTGFSIYWWRQGYAAFSQPGQMLLLQYAATLVLTFVYLGLTVAMYGVGGGARGQGWVSMVPLMMGIGSLLFGVLLPIAFYSWCAWKIADTRPWRALFICSALAAILTSTLAILLMQYVIRLGPSNIQMAIAIPNLCRGTMLLAVGALAAATDLAAQRKRSWTHWAGLILWLIGQISTLVMGVYYMFFWRIV